MAGAAGCYEDKGNYDYRDVNEVLVKVQKLYAVRKANLTYVIRPDIVQSVATDTTNLKFEWWHNTGSNQQKGTLVSTADTIAIKIDPSLSNMPYRHFMRLYITDRMTGAQYMFPVELEVVKPYEGAWMVLHQGPDGVAKLGAVTYIGENIDIIDDAYFEESGQKLTGKPSKLGVAISYSGYYTVPSYRPSCLFFCFTDNPAESGALMPESAFRLYGSPETFIYPAHRASFDIKNIVTCDGSGRARMMISGGHIFQGSLYNRSMYRVNPDPLGITGDVEITHGCCIGWTQVAFDSKGKRFIHLYSTNSAMYDDFNEPGENTAMYSSIRHSDYSLPEPDPNNLPEDEEMVYLGPGYWYGPSMMARQSRVAAYGITVSESRNKLCLYELHGNPLYSADNPDDAPFTFFNEVDNTFGITVGTPMASSTAYNRVLFYGKGNKVYRLDLGTEGGRADAIYTHPDPGAKVSLIKPARSQRNDDNEYDTLYARYGYRVDQSFAVVFEVAGEKGEVVVLNLNAAGKVTETQEGLDGFGKITDIVFI